MANRFIEFFEGDKNRLSMARLLMFLSFIPTTYIVLKKPDAELYSWYLSAYVLSYIGGKTADSIRSIGDERGKKRNMDEDS